ncbi:M23 family metallopeptidase [Devosia sp. XJ19-1]|uniref:M23 family metallopeptidase n=1 Tax=Devosia ureilytica TaxID=2952754 RepID=A0A9Q4ALC0_9HYPH|nr:M23 family metallopeptidase [Devosia ureilytica]MCP8882375.1 M23 family metallopeptidase [Devosia ureilytica]MCP8885738.1 M23 family metallopeptidase [Devosia ureilytica]
MRQSAKLESQGQKPGRRGVHPALFYGMFALLLGGNAISATGLLMAPDIARLLGGQNELVLSAYEDRLAQMRVEIDRLHSRNYAQAGDINLQLQELSQQQEVLLEQHQLVRALVTKADQLGIAAVATPVSGDMELSMVTTHSGNPDMAATSASVTQMMTETQQAMTGIAVAASERTENIVSELSKLGIALNLPVAPLDGVGGPLLAANEGAAATSPMIEDANAVMQALMLYKAARDSLELAPVHMPITGNFRQSSGYGNRKDPFTGNRAFHSGLDFAAPSGTSVLSAADGVVSFVGERSGYGKVVEVEHGNGLMTRYAHLSGYIAQKGQKVLTGTPIAKVGSTGRSTGPHLHFEVHRADTSLDPKPFLETGKRIIAMLG